MTEYGRGFGSEPWHPEDPLYGDQGSYGGQQRPQTGPHGGTAPQAPYGAGTQQPYGNPPQPDPHGAQAAYGDRPGQWDGQGQPGGPAPQYGNGGWDPSHQGPYDPYGQPPVDPHTGAGPDYYATEDAYPPPVPPHHAGQDPQAGQAAPDGGDWHPVPEPREHDRDREPAAYADGPDDDPYGNAPEKSRRGTDPDDDGPGRRGSRERRGRKPKRRNGLAGAIVAVVLVGGVGGVLWFGYGFWRDRFGPPEDFDGEGSTAVQVDIPSGTTVYDMGLVLKKAGVVKTADAFAAAVGDTGKQNKLQAGVYTLRKEMSAAAAVRLMLDPKSRNGLTVSEGLRADAVYTLIDKKLNLKDGTTKDVAKNQASSLGLPSWANSAPKIKDPLEGFLFPSTYSVSPEAKPADVLRQMVQRATAEYRKYDLEENARKLNLKSPLELLTVASLTQAEGITHDDFRKMAAVVYNRLLPTNTDTNQKVEFDSTFNYAKKQSEINISTKEIRSYDDPYNTYVYKGLPPGPIGNPGEDALKASIDPDTSEKWLYFISIDGKKTDFTTKLADHMKLVEKFNERQKARAGQ
ncbi:endolytic transglycosylase MltG [Streptomyces sp. NPDC003077]|uniref:endolytic transglycosylase MltG n=1 Tax=Streptomyces sp. NPDC003077 TaxID=3154443 RepID=UPI0033AAE295